MGYNVVVDIGCIECGAKTSVLGIFADEDEAERVLQDHEERYNKAALSQQHYFKIFTLEELNKEYGREYITEDRW